MLRIRHHLFCLDPTCSVIPDPKKHCETLPSNNCLRCTVHHRESARCNRRQVDLLLCPDFCLWVHSVPGFCLRDHSGSGCCQQRISGSGSTTLNRVLVQEIYVVNAPDIELSWVGEFTNGVHQKVPENVSIYFSCKSFFKSYNTTSSHGKP